MYDDYGPPPIDSYDLYAMGLRPPRCNGCQFARLQHELGDRCFVSHHNGWTTVYELDAEPVPGQGDPHEHDGRPIRFRSSFLSVGHSDECYHWRPEGEPGELYTVGEALVRIREAEGYLEFRIEAAECEAFGAALDAFKATVPPKGRLYDEDTRTWLVDPAYQDDLIGLTAPAPRETKQPGWLRRFRAFVSDLKGERDNV